MSAATMTKALSEPIAKETKAPTRKELLAELSSLIKESRKDLQLLIELENERKVEGLRAASYRT
ncbi:MAG: hypothetical protein AAF960_27565 [Bacteroidota bacterium]